MLVSPMKSPKSAMWRLCEPMKFRMHPMQFSRRWIHKILKPDLLRLREDREVAKDFAEKFDIHAARSYLSLLVLVTAQ